MAKDHYCFLGLLENYNQELIIEVVSILIIFKWIDLVNFRYEEIPKGMSCSVLQASWVEYPEETYKALICQKNCQHFNFKMFLGGEKWRWRIFCHFLMFTNESFESPAWTKSINVSWLSDLSHLSLDNGKLCFCRRTSC